MGAGRGGLGIRVSTRQLGVFAKAPVAGFAKTRLMPLLGADGAAACHAALIRRTLAMAEAFDARLHLWTAGDHDHPFWSTLPSLPHRLPQTGADLGERMAHALNAMHAGQHAAVIIGTDCPALTTAHLDAAFTALDTHDHVFVPAEDGGYVLVGSRRPQAALFANIDWGTDRVIAQTRSAVQRHSLGTLCELPTLWDVDEPADWHRARAAGLLG